jgi:hypothetical protein
MNADLYNKAYDHFVTSLDMETRDAVTKLMIHTRTRPDDPQMVAVCLTVVALQNTYQTQTRVLEAQQKTLEALETLKKTPAIENGLAKVAILESSLRSFEQFLRYNIPAWSIIAGVLAMCWLSTLILAWDRAYSWARSDMQAGIHAEACRDISQDIFAVSNYWRMHKMSAAADQLMKISVTDCLRK